MLTEVLATPFRWGSALRGARAFHPGGVVCTGDLRNRSHTVLPLTPGPVVARLSKGGGTPAGLPDVAGLAFRVGTPGSHWDVLLASSLWPVERIGVPAPAMSWSRATWSSLTPFRIDGELIWLRAALVDDCAPAGLDLAGIRAQLRARRPLTFVISQATGLGAFNPIAELTLTGTVDENITFDPTGTLPASVELFPAWLYTLRRRAYAGSRRGRDNS